MSQRTIVITGASDGIGAAAARKLAARGERLLLIGRSPEKLAAVADPIGAESYAADFEHLDQVRAAAAWVRERTDRIDVLANNAGGVFAEYKITGDGNERTMQVNHYAGFLFTNLLIDILTASKATIVNTSSVGAHAFGNIEMSDLDYTKKYKVMKAYGDSKLANILFAKGLDSRYHDQGLSAVAIHPGNISSNFGKETGNAMMKFIYKTPLARMLSKPESGADNLIWLMDGTPGVTWTSGQYYDEHRKPLKKPNPQQNDAGLADALWAESARRVGLPVAA
ncbi:SDR family NAD(P)-dependent oxidoreductase [Microbacterium paludicola]|uniref:SDR family NAD(P)-dependent oxidoreductase n=1 Tax=Microbacterium paludicola TaxID=300019 RepID=UPI0011A19A57|nr:SDR family NAD(P)-dependent oxidoreductase [Microbacterium paludicola]